MAIEFKYQTLFTCSVPDGYTAIKDFNELIASDVPHTATTLLDTIKMSFDNSGVAIAEMQMSHDLNHCDILIEGETVPIRVIIRSRPSLVIDGIIYKLEEFDI
jgi:hypothetical protein